MDGISITAVTGWLGVILVSIMAMTFISRRINKYLFKNKNIKLRGISAFFAKTHPYTGFLLILNGTIHGYFALKGALIIHTGYILMTSILIMMVTAVAGKAVKARNWIKYHRFSAVFVIAALILHLFFKWIFS